MILIGRKDRLGFSIGNYLKGSIQQQHITIWVKNNNITYYDDVVYLPSFYNQIEKEIVLLEKNKYIPIDFENFSTDDELFSYLRDSEEGDIHSVFCYGATTDQVSCFFVERKAGGSLLCAYSNPVAPPPLPTNEIIELNISKNEFTDILRETLDNLSNVWV